MYNWPGHTGNTSLRRTLFARSIEIRSGGKAFDDTKCGVRIRLPQRRWDFIAATARASQVIANAHELQNINIHFDDV